MTKYKGLGQNSKSDYYQPRRAFANHKSYNSLRRGKRGKRSYGGNVKMFQQFIREKYAVSVKDKIAFGLKIGVLAFVLFLFYLIVEAFLAR